MPSRPWTPLIDPGTFKAARVGAGLTMRALAEEVSNRGTPLDRGNVYRAEHGKPGAIGPRKLPVVAAVLGTDIKDLLTEHGRSVIAGLVTAPREGAPAKATGAAA